MSTAFDTFVTTQLNDQQKQAVTQTRGATLVIAGAGSGKTRVITARIAHLILNDNVDPSEIVALTFTNKAANEMKERIAHFLGDTAKVPFVGTFHSYCVRLLKKNSEKLPYPFFSILDEEDQKKLIQGILVRSGLQKKVTAQQVAYKISRLKNETLSDEDVNSFDIFNQIYNAYEQEKRASKAFDFDDLLLEVLGLFNKHTDFKTEHQRNVRHVLVDEYQDTNSVQHALLKHMALDAKAELTLDSMCVVGDEDQSIYSWRGATVTNMLHFTKDFPGTTIIKIEQNYRSVQPILQVAHHVIQNNEQRNPKKLWSAKQATDRIRGVHCLSEYQEGQAIAHLAKAMLQKKQTIAVLYRAHYQSRAIEEALIKASVPYKIIGGIQFYERKEIKDVIAYLRLVVNPFDRAAFFRIINTPTRGLGAKFEEQFHDIWHQQPLMTFADVAQKLIADGTLGASKADVVISFLKIFKGLDATSSASTALDQIIIASAYLTYLKTSCEPEEAQERIQNIRELHSAVKHFEANNITTTDQFLHEVALMREESKTNKDTDTPPVLLMSLHAAKGLEFDTVVLAGLEEGCLPSSRSLANNEAIEEERRLFYVGITRARERLLLTHSRYKYTYGTMADQMPSRFLGEIPTQLVPMQDCAYLNDIQLRTFFADWLGITHQSTVMTFSPSKPATAAKKTPVKPTVTQTSPAPSKIVPGWKMHQPVTHKKFGMGTVQKIETRDDQTVFVTVKFKTGVKKIEGSFLQKI